MSRVKFGYEEFDLTGVRTYPLADRPSKVRTEQFARAWDPSTGLTGWIDALPDLLAAADFRAVVAAMRKAHELADKLDDRATAALLETTIDATERRTWFLFETARRGAAGEE